MRGRDHEKEKWKRKRDAGREIVSAILGQPRGCESKQRGHAQNGEHDRAMHATQSQRRAHQQHTEQGRGGESPRGA